MDEFKPMDTIYEARVRSRSGSYGRKGRLHPAVLEEENVKVPIAAFLLIGCASRSGQNDMIADRKVVTGPTRLLGTAWRLEDLGGAGVLDRVQATLEFPEIGRIAGSGSCNRFIGSVAIAGEEIKIGPLGSTRMACAEAVGNQEGEYLKALRNAERFTLDGSTLLIYCKGLDKPLRFHRTSP